MIVKKHYRLFLAILIIDHISIFALETLSLSEIKTGGNDSLKQEFLSAVAQKSGAKVFIETGTWYGGTTQNAAQCFPQVHTVELSKRLYEQASEMFKHNQGVHCYFGDSPSVLSAILPTIKEKIVFWLDAHECGGLSSSINQCPLVLELKAIKNSGIKDATILIDDVRLLNFKIYWPSIQEIKDELLSINNAYSIEIFGDIIFAYLPNENYTVSPVVRACTLSTFFDCPGNDLQLTEFDIMKVEQIIANANKNEAYAIESIAKFLRYSKHPFLWLGLIAFNHREFEKAYKNFSEAYAAGINNWRVSWYRAQTAFNIKNYTLARAHLEEVKTKGPIFSDATYLEEQINSAVLTSK